MENRAPRGTVDILGINIKKWHKIEKLIRAMTKKYAIEEIRTPIFEYTEVFVKSTGESSDIVTKEMYTLYDKRGRSLTLKPEGTAGVARAFVENKLHTKESPQKLYYITPCFRYEKPESGRQRQFHQLGIEFLGSGSVYSDIEVIQFANEFLNELGIENLILEINSLGDKQCRENFNIILENFLKSKEELLCLECKERLKKNPMRVFDCKNEKCQEGLENAPKVLDTLDKECSEDFLKLIKILDDLKIKYIINKNLVRGLDYYTKTVFEFTTKYKGKNITICAGGRYNNLMKQLAGVNVKAVGFGLGMERLALLLEDKSSQEETKKIYIGSIGDEGKLKSIQLSKLLREKNYIVETDIVDRNIKKQIKYADKKNIDFTIIIGEEELENNNISIKNMHTGIKNSAKLDCIDDIVELLIKEEI